MSILERFRLDGKIALVTGAASGLGAAIAVALAEAGAHVGCHGNRRPADETSAAIRALGRESRSFSADLSTPGGADQLFADATAAMGAPDILVNNAGMIYREPAEDYNPVEWSRVMQVNLKGVWLGCRAGIPAMALYVVGRAQEDERVAESVQLAAETGIAVLEAGPSELDRLTGGAIHQGVALRVRPYEYAHPEDFSERVGATPPLIVALDGVTDPRNLGAIVRSAAAFGATGVVVPSRRSAGVTAGAWKASAGALARLPVAQAVNLTRAIEGYKKAGFFVAGLDAEATTDLREMSIADGPLVLVVGSEGRGLSRVVANACDMLVSIPMVSGNESLNAGIAASIALYEIAGVRARQG